MKDDVIYRQAAIKAIEDLQDCYNGFSDTYDKACIVGALEEVPSAQPGIIRCKDCKNSEHWYRDKRRCFLWAEDGIGVFDDGFCSYAERKENG